jgi:hypothetical protein
MKTKRENRYGIHGPKGQYNLAQGFGVSAQSNGNALGWRPDMSIVRAITFIKGLSLFGRKGTNPNSVRKEFFALIIGFTRTAFSCIPFPQAMPGARISWPFRPRLVYKE